MSTDLVYFCWLKQLKVMLMTVKRIRIPLNGLKRFVIAAVGMAALVRGYAQETHPLINSTFEGVVNDAASGEPLAGATLQLEGITHAAKTDRRGHFQIARAHV